MTKSEAYFYRLAMPRPFAKGDGAALTAIEAAAGNNVNFQDGFPSAYSAPHSGGGKFITRGEMNAIGNLASQNQFYFLAGGINTFDATFATSIGGYPEGAVLKYLNNGYLYDVISLIDNNTVNFTVQGVDGESWAYLSVQEKKVFDDVFFEGGTGATPGTALLGVVKARKTSGIVVDTSLNPVMGTNKNVYSYSGQNQVMYDVNCGIMILEIGATISSSISFPSWSGVDSTITMNWNGWKSLSGMYTVFLGYNSSSFMARQREAGFLAEVTKDYYYAIALMCGNGELIVNGMYKEIEIIDYESVSGTLKLMYAS